MTVLMDDSAAEFYILKPPFDHYFCLGFESEGSAVFEFELDARFDLPAIVKRIANRQTICSWLA